MPTSVVCLSLGACLVACAANPAPAIEAFVDDTKADGHAPKLHVLESHGVDVAEPSDLALVAGRLYTVSDAHSKIYEISRDNGDVESELDITGHDLEALAFDPELGEFLVADESKARIWHIDATGERRDPIELPDAEDGNSGIEGMAFDPDGSLYVAKEKDPSRIFVLDREGVVVRQVKTHFSADLSALAYNPQDTHLYALSDEDHALYRLNADFGVESAWRLPVVKPEGLAFDGDEIYVVSDSKERLYVFSFDEP